MTRIVTILACLLLPKLAHANFAWPPLFYAHTYTIWWVVLAGFTIEFIAYNVTIERDIKRAFKLTFVVNLASAAAGIIYSYISLIFLITEPLLFFGVYASPVFVYLITIYIEYYTAIKVLHYKKDKKLMIPIALANIPSVGMAVWQTIVLTGIALSG